MLIRSCSTFTVLSTPFPIRRVLSFTPRALPRIYLMVVVKSPCQGLYIYFVFCLYKYSFHLLSIFLQYFISSHVLYNMYITLIHDAAENVWKNTLLSCVQMYLWYRQRYFINALFLSRNKTKISFAFIVIWFRLNAHCQKVCQTDIHYEKMYFLQNVHIK